MTTIKATTTAIETPRDDFVIDDAQLAAVAFLGRADAPWTRTATISVASSSGPRTTTSPSSRRPGPTSSCTKLDGRRGTGRVYDRPSAVDGVRLLSLRPHRWTNRLEPRAVSPSAAGAPVDRARTRPLRSGRLPVRRRAVRPRPRRPGGASRVERPASERGVRHQRRGLAIERGHRTLRILGKGNYPVVVATSAAAAQHYRARPAPRPGQDIATTRLRLRWCGSRAARRRASATPRPSAAQASRGGPATPRPSRVCRSRRSRRGRRGLGSAARGR
jgi:hypothetical protein